MGIDNRNNVEQVFIANPTAGEYTIRIAHSGGLPGGQAPSAQWVSVISSGDIPLPPHFTDDNYLAVAFTSDPGAYLNVDYVEDMNEPHVWVSDGTLITGNSINFFPPNLQPSNTFFRLRRALP